MTNSDLSYPYEKFMVAIHGMATSDRSLADRIHGAYMSFHPIRSEQLQGEIKTKYDDLMDLLTKVKDGSEKDGYVINTLNEASCEELDKIAELIYDLYYEIMTDYFGH